ncbi:unnamed protein product [Urochloa humidicola]
MDSSAKKLSIQSFPTSSPTSPGSAMPPSPQNERIPSTILTDGTFCHALVHAGIRTHRREHRADGPKLGCWRLGGASVHVELEARGWICKTATVKKANSQASTTTTQSHRASIPTCESSKHTEHGSMRQSRVHILLESDAMYS